jgi:hypothetical protein
MTWLAATAIRLRFLINATGDPAGISYQLEHKINAGAWGATGTASGVACRIYPSSNIAASAATATTSQLTGGSGSFTAGRISDDTGALPSIDIGSGGNTELEWCVSTELAHLSNGDVISFRVTKAGVVLDTYSQTPTLTFATAFSVQPSPQVVPTGSTGVFSVTVTGTATLQWQTQAPGGGSWANVTGGSGATTASYTTPTLTRASDAGRLYRCVATGDWTVTSNAAAAVVTDIPASYAASVGMVVGSAA